MIGGTAYGPRLSEIGNWVGKAIYSPRAAVNKIMNRPEFDNPGIYCLKRDSMDEAFDEKIYIGEEAEVSLLIYFQAIRLKALKFLRVYMAFPF